MLLGGEELTLAASAASCVQDRVAYTAEAPEEIKSKEFRSTLMAREATKAAEAEQPEAKAPTWRGVGPWEQDWGELNVGKRPPSLFVLTVKSPIASTILLSPGIASYRRPALSAIKCGSHMANAAHQFCRGMRIA